MLRRCGLLRGIVQTLTKEKFTMSRLSNGLRVLTCDDGSGIVGMGLFMLNGSKFESGTSCGAAAVYETLPLLGNRLLDGPAISQTLGILGNAFMVVNNREAMGVMLMAPQYFCKDSLELLNAMCLHWTNDQELFERAKESTVQRAALANRDTTMRCFDLVHEAGWDGKGLGNPSIPSPETLRALQLTTFDQFHRRHIRPERTVLAATGVADHAAFALQAEQLLRFPPSDGVCEPVHAPYTGGCRMVQNTTAPESMSKFEEKNLSHLAIFLAGVPMSHPDYYTISVMQTLLGGGTSFSSGGPGKGMHTKIYREVLSRAGWINGLECITAWYSDMGLIGLYSSAAHEYVPQLLATTLSQVLRMSQSISDKDLQMAKNQLLSQIILLGEGREQLLNDMGFNMVVHDFIITPKETMAGSARVTAESMRRVHMETLRKPFTYVVYGNAEKALSYDQVKRHIAQFVEKNGEGKT